MECNPCVCLAKGIAALVGLYVYKDFFPLFLCSIRWWLH